MRKWIDKLGENYYKSKGLVKIISHVSPELKQRLFVAGASQKKRLSLDKIIGLILTEKIGEYEKRKT